MENTIYFENFEEILANHQILCGDSTQKSYIFLYNNHEIIKIYNTFNGIRSVEKLFKQSKEHFEALFNVNCFTAVNPICFVKQRQTKNIMGFKMKKVNGTTLNNIDQSNSIEHLFQYYSQAKKDIQYITEKQIILNDISQKNIMFDQYFRLIDFDEYQTPWNNKGIYDIEKRIYIPYNFNTFSFEQNITPFNLCLYHYLIETSTKIGVNLIAKTIGLNSNEIPPVLVSDIIPYIKILIRKLSEFYDQKIVTISDSKTAAKRILSK